MYEAFYGFKEKPFSMLPDPGFLFLSKKHQAALTLLEYGLMNHVGFCVITGEPGAGKTTIVRAMLQRTGDSLTVGLITNTHQSFGGLLDWVLSAFNLHQPDLTTVEKHQIFMDFLIEEYANNRTVLLIVDEAQNMNPDSLEELRMLSNVNSEKDQLLQVVLSGQPELKEMLARPELMQFAQRIAVDYHLESLSVEETCGYIQHRMLTAGAVRDVFTPAACARIHNYSGGTPRLINLLCETVLVYGFADQDEMISVELVDEMVQERMKNSVVPIVNRDVAAKDDSEFIASLEKDFPWIQPKGDKEGVEPVNEIQTIVEQAGIEESISSVIGVAKATEEKIDSERDSTSPVDNISVSSKEIAQSSRENVTDSVAPIRVASTKASPVKSARNTGDEDVNITGGAIPPAAQGEENETSNQLLKYGIISVVFSLILIVLAVLFSDEESFLAQQEQDEKIELQEQEKEATSLKQKQLEAELLAEQQAQEEAEISAKAEAEKAALAEQKAAEAAEVKAAEIAAAEAEQIKREAEAAKKREAERAQQAAQAKKIEADKRAAELSKKEAEKMTAEQEAAAAKAAKQKEIRAEQKRIAIIKAQEREAEYAAEREKRKAALLEEERRLKEQEEARRLQQEWLEKERQALEKLDSSQVIEVEAVKATAVVESVEEVTEAAAIENNIASETTTLKKKVNAECAGPTARFKANCR